MEEELYSLWDKIEATKAPAKTELSIKQAAEALKPLLSIGLGVFQKQQPIDGNLDQYDLA